MVYLGLRRLDEICSESGRCEREKVNSYQFLSYLTTYSYFKSINLVHFFQPFVYSVLICFSDSVKYVLVLAGTL